LPQAGASPNRHRYGASEPLAHGVLINGRRER
jgi:hypothetical protein